MEHGKHWLAGDKITIADFHVASIVFSYFDNKHGAGGAPFLEIAASVVGEHKHFAAWVERVRTELADHLANRPGASF